MKVKTKDTGIDRFGNPTSAPPEARPWVGDDQDPSAEAAAKRIEKSLARAHAKR